jgi:hypothetical protein
MDRSTGRARGINVNNNCWVFIAIDGAVFYVIEQEVKATVWLFPRFLLSRLVSVFVFSDHGYLQKNPLGRG